jgi:hypothetical protein
VCTRRGKEGRVSRVVHLTDDMERTLCGLEGRLELVPGAKPGDLAEINWPCKKCPVAMEGERRTRRYL